MRIPEDRLEARPPQFVEVLALVDHDPFESARAGSGDGLRHMTGISRYFGNSAARTDSTPCPKSARNRYFLLLDSPELTDILTATADTTDHGRMQP